MARQWVSITNKANDFYKKVFSSYTEGQSYVTNAIPFLVEETIAELTGAGHDLRKKQYHPGMRGFERLCHDIAWARRLHEKVEGVVHPKSKRETMAGGWPFTNEIAERFIAETFKSARTGMTLVLEKFPEWYAETIDSLGGDRKLLPYVKRVRNMRKIGTPETAGRRIQYFPGCEGFQEASIFTRACLELYFRSKEEAGRKKEAESPGNTRINPDVYPGTKIILGHLFATPQNAASVLLDAVPDLIELTYREEMGSFSRAELNFIDEVMGKVRKQGLSEKKVVKCAVGVSLIPLVEYELKQSRRGLNSRELLRKLSLLSPFARMCIELRLFDKIDVMGMIEKKQ